MNEPATRGPWEEADAPHSDIVMSCRVRLARNIAGFPFVSRADDRQLLELVHIGRSVILGSQLPADPYWVDIETATDHDRQLLVERHLAVIPVASGQLVLMP